jgi:predicted membrane channel-forming protein YqfA (hemolysin III family)
MKYRHDWRTRLPTWALIESVAYILLGCLSIVMFVKTLFLFAAGMAWTIVVVALPVFAVGSVVLLLDGVHLVHAMWVDYRQHRQDERDFQNYVDSGPTQ